MTWVRDGADQHSGRGGAGLGCILKGGPLGIAAGLAVGGERERNTKDGWLQ